MSLKNTKSEKKKPRAMPVETIVTRFKSKQKLLEKEQQNTTNNAKKQKTNKKIVPNSKKIIKQIKKVDVAEKNEIYPNKLRRKIVNKKIVLVPRHSYTVIGRIKGCNRRKLKIPEKEMSFQQKNNSSSSNELKNKQTDISIIDMVRIIEDSKSLDEEDLLEILTCPSPVWWEDPPDGYMEDAIFSRPQPKFEQKSIKTQLLEEQKREELEKIEKKAEEDLTSQTLEIKTPIEINVEDRDKTFIRKRCKLEILLDKLLYNKRNKETNMETGVVNRSDNYEVMKINSANAELNSSAPSAKLKKRIQKSQIKKRKLKLNPINRRKLKKKDVNANKKRKLDEKSKKKRNSDSFKLSDIEDDILEHLENMDIPIEDNGKTDLNLHKEKVEKKEEVQEEEAKKEQSRRILTESNKSDRNLSEDAEYLDMSVFDDVIENKPVNFNEVNEFNELPNSNANTEYVTVYKIINNEVNNDMNELKIMLPVKVTSDRLKENGGKINDYYKHSKRVNLERAKMAGNDENRCKVTDKSILISEGDAVRYCFLCSSIFDKESCDYCEKRGLKKKGIVFFCDVCGTKVDSRQEMVTHLEIHH